MNTKVKNNKILKFCIFAVVFFISFIFINTDKAYAATYRDSNGITWTYTVSSGKATNVYASSPSTINSSYLTNGTTLVVPDTLGGYPVTSVGYNSSTYNIIGKGSSTSNSYIKKLQLPSTVTSIGNYALRRLTGLTQIIGMENVTTIGSYAFQYCSALTSFDVPENVTSIGSYAFANCTKLTSLKLNDNISSLGSYLCSSCTVLATIDFNNLSIAIPANAFKSLTRLTTIKNWDNITSIGDSAFNGCTALTTLTLPTNLQTIGSSSFYNCNKIKGNLIIPENVTTIGVSAFSGCTGLDGNIEFLTEKITSIGNNTFYNCKNVKKAILPGTLISVGSSAFYGFKDIYVDTEKENSNISFASNFSGSDTAYIHYLNDEHSVETELLPGVKITNLKTGEEFKSGSFKDGSEINLQFEIDSSYNYNNLTIIIEKDGEYKNTGKQYQTLNINTNPNYLDTNLLRNTKILALDISNGLDLVARTYIDTRNGKALDIERQPIYGLENGQVNYKHTKYPVIVETGDVIVYKIRIYNEGNKSGTANKIIEYLPNGLEYIKDSKINNQYAWTASEDGRTITTEYTKNQTLSAYNGTSAPSYVELAIECRVTKEKEQEKVVRLTNFVEIAEESETDVDSVPGNIVIDDYENYKKEESEKSDSASFIQGEEDDQDFENVIILRSVPVSYMLKISKVDSEDFQLLNGAKFDLLNEKGEVLQTGVTVENGELVFDRITTYDAGIDVYYISEVETPVGYTNPLEQTIKISVVKTITDVMTESYTLEIICDLLETRIDTKIDENALVPIYTKEQLMKVGSKEEVSIKGIKYILGTDNSYRLMEDIDISGEEWKPLPNITGIFDGNNKKITGLQITDKNKKDIGLFEKFSGVIENLTLDKVSINIDLSSEIAEIKETYKNDEEELEKQLDALISPYHIGGLVGTMTGGSVLETIVNGKIETDANNVGGFIGYGENGYLTKIKNSTNNVNVSTTNSNAGGFVGYTYSALTLVNCENNGKVNAGKYNAGGFVGYSEAKDYETNVVKTEFDSTSAVVSLIIGNDRYTSSYSLKLNKIDSKTKKLIDGTEFTILDENKKVINGLEKVKVKNGILDIGTFEITTTGIDTYFIKEITAIQGYDLIDDFIKIDVIKTWDGVNSRFKISVDSSNIGEDEFISIEYVPDDKLSSLTGTNREFNQIDTVKWLVNKVVATNCTNNGEITAGANASGIFAKTNCGVDIENSTNNAKITSQNHTAGLLSEALKVDKDTNITINNSLNKGEIVLSTGSLNPDFANAGGVLANTTAYTIVKNTDNEGSVLGTAGDKTTYAGIVAYTEESIIIDTCNNKGNISSQGNYDIGSGILGKNIYPDTTIDITNCKNTGDIRATWYAGGVLGMGAGDKVRISNTESNDCLIDSIYISGGIVAMSATDIYIENCSTENINLDCKTQGGSTAGAILAVQNNATFTMDSNSYLASASIVDIKNCKVKNMNITGMAEDKGGIVGEIIDSNNYSCIEKIKFVDCTIEDSKIETQTIKGHAGMLYSDIQGYKNLEVINCNVKNSSINCGFDSGNNNATMEAGMLMGFTRSSSYIDEGSLNVADSNVENCDMKIGGVGTFGNILAYNISSRNVDIKITNCNVKSSPIQTTGSGIQNLGNIASAILDAREVIVDNCKIIDSPITTKTTMINSLISSFIGMNYTNRVEVKNTEVTNSSVTSYGGLLSILIAECTSNSYSSDYIRECIIEDCSITNCSLNSENPAVTSSYNTGANNVGILIGQNKLGDAKIKNVTIKSTTEEPCIVYADNSGGVGIGYTQHSTEIDNLNINNYKLKSKNTSSHIGGVVGKVDSSKNVSMKNSNISNLEIDTVAISGGVVSYVAGDFEMDNTTIDDITINHNVNGYGSCLNAGISAIVSKNMKITNSNINNITIESNTTNGNLSGIVSLINSGTENEFSNNEVSNISIITKGQNQGVSAGIIGITSNKLVFSNNELSNFEIKGNSNFVSAVLGMGSIDTVGNDESNKNSLKNITLNSEYPNQANIGGVIAISSNSNNKFKNITIDNINIDSNSMYARLGGIVANGSGIISDCTVKNSSIESKNTVAESYNYPCLGGIVGINTSANYNHSNLKVQNTNIKAVAGCVGGIYGLAQANISNAKLINSNVIGTSELSTVGGIFGLDGYNLTISNSSVTDSTISNVSKAIPSKTPNTVSIYPAGGIAGFAKGLVQNCDVIRTTVESTGESAYATGGIVGHGDNTSKTLHTVITECNVIDSIISGKDGVGGIAGVAVPEFNNCVVQGSETMTASLDEEEELTVNRSMKNISSNIKIQENKTLNNVKLDEVKIQEEITTEVQQEESPEVTPEAKQEESKEETTAEAQEEETQGEVTAEAQQEQIQEESTAKAQQEEIKEEATAEAQQEEIQEEAIVEAQQEKVQEEATVEAQEETINEIQEELTANIQEKEAQVEEIADTQITENTAVNQESFDKQENTKDATKEESDEEKKQEIATDIVVEEFINNDKLLNATTSVKESITPNTYAVQLLEKEQEYKNKISGTNYVGGILGYAGTILETYATTSINKCTVKDTKIEGKTDVHEDIGRSAEYPEGYSGPEIINNIIEFIKENVIVNIIE